MDEVRAFKDDNPEWEDIPDEAIPDTFTFHLWQFGQRVEDLGRAFLEGVRKLPNPFRSSGDTER